jgi:cell division protein FtsB
VKAFLANVLGWIALAPFVLAFSYWQNGQQKEKQQNETAQVVYQETSELRQKVETLEYRIDQLEASKP